MGECNLLWSTNRYTRNSVLWPKMSKIIRESEDGDGYQRFISHFQGMRIPNPEWRWRWRRHQRKGEGEAPNIKNSALKAAKETSLSQMALIHELLPKSMPKRIKVEG